MIEKQDVLSVARSLDKELTDKQAQFIVDEFISWQETDPLAHWSEIVEDIIYFVLETGPFDQLGYEPTS
jgi:hypothetical protein